MRHVLVASANATACMQKFTVFSIILSLVVVLAITDVLFHNYLGAPAQISTETVTTATEATPVEDTPLTLPTDTSTNDSVTNTDSSQEPVQLQEVPEGAIPSSLTTALFESSGLELPTLKSTPFSGLVFQFLNFADTSEATVYQWNLFSGAAFVGTIYEIKYPTDTGGFQGYLNLRDEAKTLTDLGSVNEVNNYGDASFYFNHKTKVKTVHLMVRVGANLYGFEYSQTYHEKLKNVFDSLKTLQ